MKTAIALAFLMIGAQEKAPSTVQEFLQGLEKAEVTFFQISPAPVGSKPADPNAKTLRNWIILREKVVKEAKEEERIRKILADPKTYGDMGAKCFEPGLAFRFKGESKEVELVVCLKCSWIYCCQGATFKSVALSKEGVSTLLELYKDMVK